MVLHRSNVRNVYCSVIIEKHYRLFYRLNYQRNTQTNVTSGRLFPTSLEPYVTRSEYCTRATAPHKHNRLGYMNWNLFQAFRMRSLYFVFKWFFIGQKIINQMVGILCTPNSTHIRRRQRVQMCVSWCLYCSPVRSLLCGRRFVVFLSVRCSSRHIAIAVGTRERSRAHTIRFGTPCVRTRSTMWMIFCLSKRSVYCLWVNFVFYFCFWFWLSICTWCDQEFASSYSHTPGSNPEIGYKI